MVNEEEDTYCRQQQQPELVPNQNFRRISSPSNNNVNNLKRKIPIPFNGLEKKSAVEEDDDDVQVNFEQRED